jgi:glycosyltransferase involved in cell wall biosynthesis
MKLTAVIPAYNPPEEFVSLVGQLAASDFERIIVVNDGSDRDRDPLFQAIERVEKVTLLRHAVNLGQGAALKTGLNHAYCHFVDLMGVVTIDADGQHLLVDVLRVADALKRNPETLVLGARAFDTNVPFRSRIGNRITRFLFRLLVGQKLSDTQSGLRGIPRPCIPRLLKIGSNGFEFNLDVLLTWKYWGLRIIEQPIQTVYIKGNESSHFNPIVDSMRIYFVLFRFTIASLSAALIDYTVFILTYALCANLLAAQALARMVAMIFNYFVVKKLVFCSGEEVVKTFPKYAVLALFSGSVSYLLIRGLTSFSPLPVLAAKAIVESLIFFANFAIQREFIFVKQTESRQSTSV